MNEIHLTGLDLNLLRLFDILMEERNVTRAGQRLGLTQSAVSHALNRLRFALHDDLFVRGVDGMRPTPWAVEAAPKVHQALSQLQDALAPSSFDPATSGRRFVVAVTPYVSEVLAPPLFERFRREAPAAALSLRPVEAAVSEALDASRIDMAIAGFGRTPDRFDSEKLFEDKLVWVVRADHPAAAATLTTAGLADLPRLILSLVDGPDGQSLSEGGLERRVVWGDGTSVPAAAREGGAPVCTCYDVPSALFIVSRSDLAALVPSRLVERFSGPQKLTVLEPPHPSAPAELTGVWRRDHGERPAMQWFRAVLRDEASRL